jgi:PRTRC genetic system protein B
MDVSLFQKKLHYRARKALIMYGEDNGSINLVTMHDVDMTSSGPTIKEGVQATKTGLFTLFQSLSDHVRPKLKLMDEHIIAINDDAMIWWVPSQKRRIAFDADVIGKRCGVVPHPPLLFWICNGDWRVAALTENKRPTGSSKLAVSPYFNVSDYDWAICDGTTALPRGDKKTEPSEWNRAFFESAFTHTRCDTEEGLIKYKGGHNAFWIDMLDGKFKTFPLNKLVKTERTLQSLIDDIKGGNYAQRH